MGVHAIMGTFNFWLWALLAIVVFAVVLPAVLATVMVRFGPRHDAPPPARLRRTVDGSPAAATLSLLTGIAGDGH